MGFPEDGSTLCGTAQLMRLTFGVVLPEVSTPFIHAVGWPRTARRGSIVDGKPFTMPAKWVLENARGLFIGRDN